MCLETAISTMQQEFDEVTRWCHDFGLVINATKTKIMHIRAPNKQKETVNIFFQNPECPTSRKSDAIELVQSIKYLGVTIDEHFLWHEHITIVRKSMRSAMFALFHLERYSTKDVQKQVYYSLVESQLRYGVLAWGNAAKTHTDKLLNLQRRIVNMINKNHLHLKCLNVENIFRMTAVLEYYDDSSDLFHMVYTVVAKAFVYYLLPLSIIGALYILMANRLHISAREMPGEALGMQSRAQARARRHVARMVVAFVVVFFVCFFPSHLFSLWFQLNPQSQEEFNDFWHVTRIIGFCTSFLNSCANPVALYCVSGVFRQHFNRYLCCWCCKPAPRNRQHSTTGALDTSIMSTRRSTNYTRSSLHMNNNSGGHLNYHNHNNFQRQQSLQMQHSVINSNGGSSPTQSIILSDKR
ncbi:neuropeptide CCHamide-2 receptor-like [Eupeodes corollae]|uniref:neuropeptide CCHamide-2 receptor-like n=1 Tax=Eupeodes corollae TaxID=290404 RepID=UPI002491F90D|nr:neuropeptide CCHamide-2 receptor-like [Eupeodes corollae]